jgi:AraC family transcriptional regulator of adaptative response/methylated-DNA-[protein]-cysteine methyltransferase
VPTIVQSRITTPLGPMVALATDDGVALLEFEDRPELPAQARRVVTALGRAPISGTHPHVRQLRAELDEYWAGRRPSFAVPLVLLGTPFQVACWTWLQAIPAGTTRTYGQGAAGVGRPAAVRAFAHANGANRLAILVPCHRVVGRDGALTGYGGGLARKRALLDLEAGSGRGSLADQAPDGSGRRAVGTPREESARPGRA